MCYICNCFAWTLDLIQRAITFALACLMAFAVCFGLTIAIVAGIAYGYNYSMAEFLTFTRTNVSVFMRRGQFLDTPDLFGKNRRMGNHDDAFSTNITNDYQDENRRSDSRSLSDSWNAAEETRRYAEKLTKYAAEKSYDTEIDAPNNIYSKISLSPVLTEIPIFGIPTAVWKSGSSKIIMRNFPPVEEITSAIKSLKDYDDENFHKNNNTNSNERTNNSSESNISKEKNEDGVSENLTTLNSLSFSTYKAPPVLDYPSEDVEEDKIIYKPV
ncbi:uncharacterized protein LOC101739614 [Bombyx mori]|uniref:Uncharacterized protein n=1 Tax=Bombyx mori TaxID=7091 RepID=A0A8R2AX34_BOMMO|nr:uncharacterized protein LOC101739614 [Bombyx mori]